MTERFIHNREKVLIDLKRKGSCVPSIEDRIVETHNRDTTKVMIKLESFDDLQFWLNTPSIEDSKEIYPDRKIRVYSDEIYSEGQIPRGRGAPIFVTGYEVCGNESGSFIVLRHADEGYLFKDRPKKV